MKSISAIDQAFPEDMKCLITKVRTPLIDQNIEFVALLQCITVLHFQILQTLWIIT